MESIYQVSTLNIQAFQHEINAIASGFQTNRVPFDKTRACLICGQSGHDFTGCSSLQDNEKARQA